MTVRIPAYAAFFLLFLAGCQTPPPQTTFAEITFGHETPFTFMVSSISVDAKYRSSMQAPNVEHLAPIPPERALRRWATDRLRSSGAPGQGRFIVLDASIRESRLPVTEGLRGAFTKDQSSRFDATIEASLELVDERGLRRGFASARVIRSQTIREDATLVDRDKMLFGLVDDLMKDFNREMERNIRQYLVGYML